MLVLVFLYSENFECVVVVCENFVGLVTQEYVFDVAFAEVLLGVVYGGKNVDKVLLCLDLCFRVQAVVAVAAVVLVVLFAEIVEQQFPAAYGAFGVGCRLAQELAADVLFGNGFAFH